MTTVRWFRLLAVAFLLDTALGVALLVARPVGSVAWYIGWVFAAPAVVLFGLALLGGALAVVASLRLHVALRRNGPFPPGLPAGREPLPPYLLDDLASRSTHFIPRLEDDPALLTAEPSRSSEGGKA